MKIKEIELYNWGRYPKVTLNVNVTKENNVVLIRARNNQGKTTLFYAIKYALYGKFGLKNHKNQNEPFEWINRQAAAKGDGEMYVELTIEHDGKEFRIQRGLKFFQTNTGLEIQTDGKEKLEIFDQEAGKPLSDAGKEIAAKQNWIDSMLIPLDVSQFFFFDGEDIKRYTDEPEESVKTAILRVLGIKVLINAKTDLENIQKIFNELHNKKLNEQSKDEKTKLKLKEKQDQIKEHEIVIEHLTGALKQAEKLRDSYTEKLRQNVLAQEKIKERQRIKDANHILDKNLKDNDITLRDLRGISSLLLLHPLLKIIDSTEENPPSKDQWESKTAQHMIYEKFEKCVCETDIDNKIKEILENKVIELRPNPQAQLKRFVEDIIARTMPDSKFSELRHANQERIRIQGEIDTNNTTINKINQELSLGTPDEIVKMLKDKEENAQSEIMKIGRDVERAEDQLENLSKEEGLLKRKLEQAIDSEELKTAEEQKKFVQKVRDGIQKSIDAYYKLRKPQLEKHVSDVFLRLINMKKLYTGITIDDDWEMKVKYFDGSLLPTYQYGPSAGASQIVATAFIAGLNKFAQKAGPVVIDTPLGRLDDIHRTNLLEYYNKMSDQVIILYTPTEINDKDQVILEDYVKEHYEIIPYDDMPDLARIVPYERLI